PLAHGQQMLHPKIEAHLLQSLNLKPSDRVLEVGTGSGCVTAMIASLAGHVDSLDIFADMQQEASKKLAAHNINNVTMIEADGSAGWGSVDEYDAIAITGSMPELPQQYVDALKIGGRLFAIIGEGESMEMIQVTRPYGDKWERKSIFETYVPPLVNAVKPPKFVF
ncbi:MAG: protein-L-isoaspartate O-methyltransferase, partial [Gammaproteobacteria bacterium]|nr:protein-L-isoaspartate O-methyltransferase [Gammaproteobacteria bacterium]